MKYKAILLLIFLSIVASKAQEKSRFQFGIQCGNNLNPSSFQQNDWIEGNNLYRSSFGVLVKQDLRKSVEMLWGSLGSKLHFYLYNGISREETLSRTGTYLSLDLNHFFGKKRKIDIKDVNPVIFCPHF